VCSVLRGVVPVASESEPERGQAEYYPPGRLYGRFTMVLLRNLIQLAPLSCAAALTLASVVPSFST
jgi:hypothetical protein